MTSAPTATSLKLVRLVVALGFTLVLSAVPMASDAQSNDEIESIREQRRAVEAQTKEKALEINVADAELEQVSATLAAITSSVNAQEGRLANAQQQLVAAEDALAGAEAAVLEGEAAIERLTEQLAARAIVSFVTRGNESVLLVQTDDPNLAVRMQRLVDDVTQSDVDVGELLRTAEEDLAIERQLAADSAIEAADLRQQMEGDLVLLEEDRAIQADLSAEAEARLDAFLSERAALEAQGFQLDQDLKSAQDAYAAELARKSAAAPSGSAPTGPGGAKPPVASPSEIVNVGSGIWVHESISANISQLLADAAAANVTLAGGGYRDPAGQIAVRKNNCGTSDYAVYQMPASQCRPPTAKPGSSMHERGLAVDFTYQGRIIGRRSGPAWDWLKANAASYGLFNLPSEPWHWSTTGG